MSAGFRDIFLGNHCSHRPLECRRRLFLYAFQGFGRRGVLSSSRLVQFAVAWASAAGTAQNAASNTNEAIAKMRTNISSPSSVVTHSASSVARIAFSAIPPFSRSIDYAASRDKRSRSLLERRCFFANDSRRIPPALYE